MPPAPAPVNTSKGAAVDEDALASMLMSWYLTGYHTGYYQVQYEHFILGKGRKCASYCIYAVIVIQKMHTRVCNYTREDKKSTLLSKSHFQLASLTLKSFFKLFCNFLCSCKQQCHCSLGKEQNRQMNIQNQMVVQYVCQCYQNQNA